VNVRAVFVNLRAVFENLRGMFVNLRVVFEIVRGTFENLRGMFVQARVVLLRARAGLKRPRMALETLGLDPERARPVSARTDSVLARGGLGPLQAGSGSGGAAAGCFRRPVRGEKPRARTAQEFLKSRGVHFTRF
jgi:hypothetical protein